DAGGDRGGGGTRRAEPGAAAGTPGAGGDHARDAGRPFGAAARLVIRQHYPAALLVEGAQVGGDVDGVGAKDLKRHDLERALVGRGQHDRRGGAVLVRLEPVGRGHAPPVARHEPGEPELGHRRRQVVADPALVLEELGGHHRADGVAAQVLGAGRAASVPVEAGERIGATRLKLAAEHITVAHACSIRTAHPRSQDRSRASGCLDGYWRSTWRAGAPGQALPGRLVLTVWSVKIFGSGLVLLSPRRLSLRHRSTAVSWSWRCVRSGRAGCCRGRRTWTPLCSAGSSGTFSAAAGCAWRAASSCRDRK